MVVAPRSRRWLQASHADRSAARHDNQKPLGVPAEGPCRPYPKGGQPHDSTHLLALAAKAMRQVLVDHARARRTVKRGSGAGKVEFDESIRPGSTESSSAAMIDVLALDEAITKLERVDPRLAELITLRFFAGLTVQQAATVLGVSTFTAEQDWRTARAWLADRLTPPGD